MMTRNAGARILWSIAVSTLALGGCATSYPARLKPITAVAVPNPPVALPLQLLPEERHLLGDRKVDWGLALSGGGLRAAFFSLGVLKSLYDDGTLDDVDIISTVSGGGYTGYWLYANHITHWKQGQRFGAYSLSADTFPTRLCELMTTSNFVPYGRLIGVISRKLPIHSVNLYENSLYRTFGNAEPATGLQLPDLASTIARHEAPYLIQNATVILPRSDPSWQHKLIEFTPLSYGTTDIGYLPWNGDDGTRSLPLRKTTAISGAAFAPLKQIVPLRHPATGTRTFRAHDGGKSENLGAIALIRRGVPNVIVADAEHDPGYIFDAYRNLRAGLALYGLDLSVPEIDSYLTTRPNAPFARALAKGTVVKHGTGELVSTIYYLKAAMADELSADLARQRAPGSPGASGQASFYQSLAATAAAPGGPWRCKQLRSAPLAMTEWAAYNVANYSDWLRSNVKARVVRIVADTIGVAAMRIDFPQYSTADQSFYVDQAQAFVGLGYLQARGLRSPPKK